MKTRTPHNTHSSGRLHGAGCFYRRKPAQRTIHTRTVDTMVQAVFRRRPANHTIYTRTVDSTVQAVVYAIISKRIPTTNIKASIARLRLTTGGYTITPRFHTHFSAPTTSFLLRQSAGSSYI